MASIYKRTRDKTRRGSHWYIAYDDENGRRKTKKGFTDKRATEELATELEREVRRIKEGLVDPGEAARRDARKASLDRLVDRFDKYMQHNSPKHVKLVLARVRKVVEVARWTSLGECHTESFREAMSFIRKKQDIGNRTYNHYLQAVESFGNYLVAQKLCLANPFLGVPRMNNEVDVRHARRALTFEEVLSLVKAARESGITLQSFDGETRARIYIFSFMTGLRRRELGSLTRDSFNLTSNPPTLTVEAGCSKHRKKDILPLHPELAAMLPEWLEGLDGGQPLFPLLGEKKTWFMIRKDLEAAGIPYETSEGIADFHAAGRHSHITELMRNGVSLPQARELARHSDVRMTMRYTHIGLADQAKAVSHLPWTGKEPVTPAADEEKSWQRSDSGTGHTSEHLESSADSESHSETVNEKCRKSCVNGTYGIAFQRLATDVTETEKATSTGLEPELKISKAIGAQELTLYVVSPAALGQRRADNVIPVLASPDRVPSSLRFVVEHWLSLPPHIIDAITTLVESSTSSSVKGS